VEPARQLPVCAVCARCHQAQQVKRWLVRSLHTSRQKLERRHFFRSASGCIRPARRWSGKPAQTYDRFQLAARGNLAGLRASVLCAPSSLVSRRLRGMAREVDRSERLVQFSRIHQKNLLTKLSMHVIVQAGRDNIVGARESTEGYGSSEFSACSSRKPSRP
jgi:hypothetical protein